MATTTPALRAASNPLERITHLSASELIEGLKYLKVRCRVIRREHDGWCSTDDIDYVSGEERPSRCRDIIRTDETITRYYTVPTSLQQETTFDMRPDLYDAEDGTVKNTDETETLFEDFTERPDCGLDIDYIPYCGLYNTVIPITIQYVRYTR
jgi:hypothetical protein